MKAEPAAIVITLLLFLGPSSVIFAQSDDLSTVLENAQNSLATEKNNSTKLTSARFTVPSNANLWTRIQLEPHEYIETRYVIPSKSSFNFSSGSILCPENPCEQEFFDGVFRKESFAPNKYFFAGILKIIDKSVASGPDIHDWLYYPFDGEFVIKSTKENIKTGNIVEAFVGNLGLDRDELKYSDTHDIEYSITGTFEQPSNALTLIGRLP